MRTISILLVILSIISVAYTVNNHNKNKKSLDEIIEVNRLQSQQLDIITIETMYSDTLRMGIVPKDYKNISKRLSAKFDSIENLSLKIQSAWR